MRIRTLIACLAVVGGLACSSSPPSRGPQAPGQGQRRSVALPPELPDSTGWGVHVLAMSRDSFARLWVGTWGEGLFVLGDPREEPQEDPEAEGRPRGPRWRHIEAGENSIAWNLVNSIAFTKAGHVWYGTVGGGFGRSDDDGTTWRNWTQEDLGPRWQYVALNGVATLGDTVFVATGDGLRITRDDGATWTCLVARGSTTDDASCGETLPVLADAYLLALHVDLLGRVWIGSPAGAAVSSDGGRSWRELGEPDGIPAGRVRAIVMNTDTAMWLATERAVFVDSMGRPDDIDFHEASIRPPGLSRIGPGVRAMVASPGTLPPTFALADGMVAGDTDTGFYRLYFLSGSEIFRPVGDQWAVLWWGPPTWPIGGSATGLNRTLAGDFRADDAYTATRVRTTAEPRHAWLQRPIAETDNPYIDPTYPYAATMGGRFQEHQGVEFNNAAGTEVLAAADGVVVFAGDAEAGSQTVAIRHDRDLDGQSVYTTYYHNSWLAVAVGDRVEAGQVIARVGNTGRATNNHLHLEVHVAPADAPVSDIVSPEQRFPPHTVNPQLWLAPREGTGIVAGRVLDSRNRPVQGAEIHGLVLPYPSETPYSFTTTYGENGHPDPAYDENFAVGDVPAGEYLLGVIIGDQRVWRRIEVEAGKVTFVEFRPS